MAAVVVICLCGLGWYGYRLQNGGGTGGAVNVAAGTTLSGPKITAKRLSTGLTINANASDWPENTATFDSNALVFGNEPSLRGTWGLAWDDESLYVIVQVEDSVFVQTHANDTSQLFKGDGVNFEFGTAQPKNGNTSLEPGDRHVMLGPATATDDRVLGAINVASGTGFVAGTNSIQGLSAKTSTTNENYLLEAAIPWSTLGVDNPQAGAQFGMNLNVSDAVAEGARKGELSAMVSNNPNRRGNDASFRSIWGTLTLQG